MGAGKKSKIAGDFIYTFVALVIMNVVLQLVVYPLINRSSGAEYLGDIVYYTGLIYMLSASVGNACSNQRLLCRKNELRATNGDFNLIVASAGGLIAVIYAVVMLAGEGAEGHWAEAVLFGCAALVIFLRYYAEAEFRLTLNFKGYLIYYLIVSGGYLLGYLLFRVTGYWTLIFVLGEGLAVLYVFLRGGIFKPEKRSENFGLLLRQVGTLAASYILIFLVSQYYKFFIKQFFSAYEVTQYYVASFFGKSLDMVITPISTLIMSYLTRSKEGIDRTRFQKIVLLVLGIGAVLYVGFIIATPIYAHIFYGKGMAEDVSRINLIVNLAQAIAAIASILSVFVLSQLGAKIHFRLQVLYCVSYVVLTSALSATSLGITGFAIGAVCAFAIRFITTAVVGYKKMPRAEH